MNSASRSASSSSSARAARGMRPNGPSLTRSPSYRHVPATTPSTRNVLNECGVFVLKMAGR